VHRLGWLACAAGRREHLVHAGVADLDPVPALDRSGDRPERHTAGPKGAHGADGLLLLGDIDQLTALADPVSGSARRSRSRDRGLDPRRKAPA
jgi:hypothetical protein